MHSSITTLLATELPEYTLLATGDGHRYEKWGTTTILRPDPNVIWPWTSEVPKADLRFTGERRDDFWLGSSAQLAGWEVSWRNLRFHVKPTPFRHLGLFPEQAVHWSWLTEVLKPGMKVLNLFAYTGAASVVAASMGAEVTHVDASAGSCKWAGDNAQLSGLSDKAIRWIVEDVRKFVAREVRRGNKYDAILMDAPVFGRGSKGEVWRVEEDLSMLLGDVSELLVKDGIFLMNTYASSLYPLSVQRLVEYHIAPVVGKPLTLSSVCLLDTEKNSAFQTGFSVRT